MNIARSSYYYKAAKPPGDDVLLVRRIEEIVEEFGRYGYRRVTAQLQRDGWAVNRKRVLRIMREHGWLCRVRRRSVRTTNSNHPYGVYPNLVGNLVVTGKNQVWVADITYIRLRLMFVYLAVILDLFSRRAIGYALSRRIDTQLTLTALRMAIRNRQPGTGVIHHSDQGVQYAAGEYVDELHANGFRISMSRRGNPYDNANAESFMKTFKSEEVELNDYQTEEDALERIPYFLEEVYNQKRLHSSLGYRPPVEFEELTEDGTNQPSCPLRLGRAVQ